MNDGGDCKTASATPGLLITNLKRSYVTLLNPGYMTFYRATESLNLFGLKQKQISKSCCVTCHFHMSLVTCHLSYVTCQISSGTWHTCHLSLKVKATATYPSPAYSSTIDSTLSSLWTRVLSVKSGNKIIMAQKKGIFLYSS